ncbi:MAG: hypothetical protein IPL74_12320 [Bacteroidetes bacterium]|nr:hypothetical protein [Bacteroidota bacterium]
MESEKPKESVNKTKNDSQMKATMPYLGTQDSSKNTKAENEGIRIIKTIPPGFNAFYKNLVNYYFQALEN